MPYDESYAPEAPDAGPVALEAAPDTTAAVAPDVQALAPETPEAEAPVEAGSDSTADDTADDTPAAAPPAEAPLAFDEKAYLKQHFGDDAPDTATALAERIKTLQASARTTEDDGRAALLQDPAKLAAFAKAFSVDYDKMELGQVLREKFALANPEMPEKLLNTLYAKDFATKYPLLAEYAADPEAFDADDPALTEEREAAEYFAKQDRAALKEHQATHTRDLLAQARTGAAPTPESQAIAKAALDWADQTIIGDYALPIDVGNGQVLKMPVGDAAAFKAAFSSTDALYQAQVLTADGKINPQAQAKIALFLRNPAAYDAALANAVKAAQPASLPIDELTNARSTRSKAQPTATAAGTQYGQSDDWHSSNA